MALSTALITEKPLKAIIAFTIPILLGNFLQQIYSVCDAMIVGNALGVDALSAVGGTNSVIFCIIGFCVGCCAGFGIPIAQRFGANDYDTLRKYVYCGTRLALIISFSLAIVTVFFCRDILRIMQMPETIFEDSWSYLVVIFAGIPITFFYNFLASIIRALGDSKTPFYFLLLSTLLNICLDLLFIVVLGTGVMGASIATVLAQLVSCLLCFVLIRRNFSILKFEESDKHDLQKATKILLSIGLPMGLQFSITALGSIIMQSANNSLGTHYVAAFTSASRLEVLFMCPYDALGLAMATYCSQNLGAGLIPRISTGIKRALLMVGAYTLFVYIAFIPLAKILISLFIDGTDIEGIIADGTWCLRLAFWFYPFLGVLFLLRNCIQGLGYTKLALFSGVSEMVARIVAGAIFVPIYGFVATAYGDPAAWISADLFLIPAFFYVFKRIKN